MIDKDDKSDKAFQSEFTGSIQSIIRLDQLLKDCSSYAVNEIVIGFRNNLREVLKEGQGYLTRQEYIKAFKDWKEIEGYDISIDEDNITVKFDSALLKKLHEFDFWLRHRLFKRGATMGAKAEFTHGMQKLMTKYGIERDGK